jgi:phosphoglycerol transferase MdoB-like AlkP superfamily enzyme
LIKIIALFLQPMRNEFTHYILLAKRLSLSLVIFALCRLVFLVYNYHYFSGYATGTIASTFFYGLRFDISTVLYLNALLYILHILPFNFRNTGWYQKMLLVIFVTFNTAALIFELGDTANYKFSHKRLTSEFFGVLGDFRDQLVSYMATYWYLIVFCFIVIYSLIKVYNSFTGLKEKRGQKTWVQILLMLPAIALFIVGARGGLQLRPISPITALQSVDAPLSPMVYNTCFSLGCSFEFRSLEEQKFFSDEQELKKQFSQTRCYYNDSLPQKHRNVVVIILESFSKYFVQSLSHEEHTYTPFLDSMIYSGKCYVAANGYANARHSHEGNAAILASIPSLMIDPFMTSIYQSNATSSYAGILKKQGYSTAFFHGAKNGSMMLDAFSKSCGFENYYGKDEYPDQNDYDGNWGIYDDKFFPFFAGKLNTFKQPFAATIFSLSSHFPYVLTEENRKMFPEDKTKDPELPMIMYTDHVLKMFFDSVKKEPWYNNTLFVLTADHTYDELSNHATYLSKFSIPILFFAPSDTAHKPLLTFPVQQVDIMPSILDYLNVPDTFKCFGNSVFAPGAPHYAFNFEQGLYQITEDDALLQFNGREAIGFYDLRADPMQKNNIIKSNDIRIEKLTNRIKAVIQTYNRAMITNQLN